MKKLTLSIAGLTTLLLLSTANLHAGGWGQGIQKSGKAGSADNKTEAVSGSCSNYFISGQVTQANDTNGSYGSFAVGDTFTFIATGNGTGTWRVVGDPEGSITYASGGAFPGTLIYTIPAGQSADGIGMGFYVDSYTGEGDTITGSCGEPSRSVPALGFWTRMLLVLSLGLAALAVFRRKQRQQIH